MGCACKRGRPCQLFLARTREKDGCDDDRGTDGVSGVGAGVSSAEKPEVSMAGEGEVGTVEGMEAGEVGGLGVVARGMTLGGDGEVEAVYGCGAW